MSNVKILTISCFAAACVLLPAPVLGDTSKDLVHLCEQYMAMPKPTGSDVTPEYIQLKSSCAGFINSHVKMSKPEDGFCVSKGYNMDDLARIYADWAKAHPDRWDEPTRTTMTAALAQVYPCKN